MVTRETPPISDKEKISLAEEDSTQISNDLDALPEPGSPERILAERRLVRLLDLRVLPTVFLIYIMNYIDVGSPQITIPRPKHPHVDSNSGMVLQLRG